MSIYLDYNASAPIDERVLKIMTNVYLDKFGNADSRTHLHGESAREIVEKARGSVSRLFAVPQDEVIFTSGSTESNNIVILGLEEYGRKTSKNHIITTEIEHKSVLNAVQSLENKGFIADYVKPKEDGRIDSKSIIDLVREDTLLVCVMHGNNETGTLQPIQEVGEYLNNRGVHFHVDATQTSGKMVDEIQKCKYNTLSMSAHKLAGPQGVGALVMRKKRYQYPPIKPIQFGGGQEKGLRPGTLPVALIAGLGEACELAKAEYKTNLKKLESIKRDFLNILNTSGLCYCINGNQEYCMPNTLNISFSGVDSEALMIAARQYCSISNGSACTSKDYSDSYVLHAMGYDHERIREAVRFSWGSKSKLTEEMAELIAVIKTLQS